MAKQGQKRPLETPKRMIERRERESQKERSREGGRDKRERERGERDIYRESEKLQKLQKSKEKSLNLKSYINRIFTP